MARVKRVKKLVLGRTNWAELEKTIKGKEETELIALGKVDSFELGVDKLVRYLNTGTIALEEGSDLMNKKVNYFLNHTADYGCTVEYDDVSKTMFLVACERTHVREEYRAKRTARESIETEVKEDN